MNWLLSCKLPEQVKLLCCGLHERNLANDQIIELTGKSIRNSSPRLISSWIRSWLAAWKGGFVVCEALIIIANMTMSTLLCLVRLTLPSHELTKWFIRSRFCFCRPNLSIFSLTLLGKSAFIINNSGEKMAKAKRHGRGSRKLNVAKTIRNETRLSKEKCTKEPSGEQEPETRNEWQRSRLEVRKFLFPPQLHRCVGAKRKFSVTMVISDIMSCCERRLKTLKRLPRVTSATSSKDNRKLLSLVCENLWLNEFNWQPAYRSCHQQQHLNYSRLVERCYSRVPRIWLLSVSR